VEVCLGVHKTLTLQKEVSKSVRTPTAPDVSADISVRPTCEMSQHVPIGLRKTPAEYELETERE